MSEENIRLRIFESRSGDIEDLLSELNLGSCRVEKITREYGQPSSAVISMHRDAAEKRLGLLIGQDAQARGGHYFHILPEVFESVKVTVNKQWITAMERCGISLPQRILQDACQKTGAKLDRSSVNYTVSGNLEVVARTMNEVHGVDWTEISIRQQQQPGSGLYAVGNDISDSDTNKDEQRQSTANPPAARQRRLKVEVADVSNTEYEKMWQTEANQKQEKNKPERRLKQLNTGGSEEAAVGPADDMHSSAVMPANRTGHVDRRVVLLPTVKHHHIINHFNRDISSLMDRCSSFNVQEDNDDTKWTFMARSVEELSNIQTELIKIVSRLTMEDVRIPSSLDMSMVKQVIQMNKYSGSVTIDVNEHTRLCLICGNDTAEVAHTKEWLEHTLSCQTYFPSQYRKPTDSVNDHHDVKTSHAGVRCDFVVGMSEYGNTLEFTTSSGTTVHIHQADMLRQQTEVIVNSANNQLGHHGGLARAILTAGGPVIDAESRSIIASRGALNTGDVVHTSAGNIPAPVRYVIHAVPPSGHQMETGSQQQGMDALIRTFLGSLQYANDKLKVASISLPPFGAGIFAVAVDKIMRAAFTALQLFNTSMSHGSGGHSGIQSHDHHRIRYLQDVHLISNDAQITQQMISAFKHMITDSH